QHVRGVHEPVDVHLVSKRKPDLLGRKEVRPNLTAPREVRWQGHPSEGEAAWGVSATAVAVENVPGFVQEHESERFARVNTPVPLVGAAEHPGEVEAIGRDDNASLTERHVCNASDSA